MKNILYLAHRIPYPPNKGDKIRSFNEIRHLSTIGNIYLGALVDNESDNNYGKALKKWCHETFFVPFPPSKKKLLSLLGFLKGVPISVQYFYEYSLQKKVNNWLRSHNFELIFCFSSPMAEYIFRTNKAFFKSQQVAPLLVMDFCDVDSYKWKEYSDISRWPFSKIYLRESNLLSHYERIVAENFHFSIFVSERERELFEQINPGIGKTITIGNGVDLEYFNPYIFYNKSSLSSPSLLFTGAMDYYANIDGVSWFVEEIWPGIKNEVPETTFYIVGANPSSRVKKLHNGSDIIVTGYVNDIRPYYQNASVCVIPLRIARGIQNKVLEAMAMARPVVCTPNAFEGIRAIPGKDLIIASSPVEFTKSVITLLKDKNHCQKLGNEARLCMETNYDWDVQLEPLKQILTSHVTHHTVQGIG